ncbi:hypothetical protein [Streptomyces sp. NPDC005408]|uniref:hypothetical protein n=1 Tax=Streptomyces sp. NPDC005408 TaxID=3155341 RepID=UPI0033B67D9D
MSDEGAAAPNSATVLRRHPQRQASAAVFEEAADGIAAALTERRHSLRAGWHGEEEGRPAEADTEQLRAALQAYRDVTERLLHI